MGKIKSKLVRRTSQAFITRGVNFSEDFDKNKRILETSMPSKKLRNQIAGYLSRVKKQERMNRPKALTE
jgi:ribosomal protein S17E